MKARRHKGDSSSESTDEEESESSGKRSRRRPKPKTKRLEKMRNKPAVRKDNLSKPAPQNKYDALAEMKRGTALLKYGRRGYPHFRQFQISADCSCLEWFSRRKKRKNTKILIADIKDVLAGQKTDIFRRVEWPALKPASFSVVYGIKRKTLDVVAKSIDECRLWIEGLQALSKLARAGTYMAGLKEVGVTVDYRDRNRPKSRENAGDFRRGNDSSETTHVDRAVKERLETELKDLKAKFAKLMNDANHPVITASREFHSVNRILSELEERLEELTHEVVNTKDTKITENDVWRTKVDIEALTEKVYVLRTQPDK